MSKAIHSAGPAVVSRGSDEIKGSPSLAPKFRPIGAGLPAVLTGLFSRARENLSESDLEHLAGLSDDAMMLCGQIQVLCEGLGALMIRDRAAGGVGRHFQSTTHDLPQVMFLLASMAGQAGGLLEVACDADNALAAGRDGSQASARSAG